MTWLSPIAGGVRLQVQVQPRATRTATVGLHGDALKVRLAAPPVGGAANEALIRWVAEELGVPRARVRLTSGATGRRKVVEVTGVTVAEARRLAG